MQEVVIPAPLVRAGSPGTCYVGYRRNADAGFPSTTFSCELKYKALDCDPDTGVVDDGEGFECVPLVVCAVLVWAVLVGSAGTLLLSCHCALVAACAAYLCSDSFPLEAFEVNAADFMAKVAVPNFRAAWEAMTEEGEVVESFALSFKTVAEAVPAVMEFLGMGACDGTGVVKEGTNKHNAYLSGVFLGGVRVLARIALGIDDATGCVLKIGVRSEDPAISRLVADCIH